MGLIDKFSSPERRIKELVINFIFKEYNQILTNKDIIIKNKVLIIKLNPVLKTEIVINKYKLLNFLNQEQNKIIIKDLI